MFQLKAAKQYKKRVNKVVDSISAADSLKYDLKRSAVRVQWATLKGTIVASSLIKADVKTIDDKFNKIIQAHFIHLEKNKPQAEQFSLNKLYCFSKAMFNSMLKFVNVNNFLYFSTFQ